MEAALIVISVVLLLAWAIVTQSRAIRRVWWPVVRIARGSTGLAAVLSVVLYVTGLFAFGVVWALVHALVGGLAAKVVVMLLIVAYTPVAIMALPDRASSPYRDVRRGLVKAGATRKQARACAWATGPLTFVGMGVIGGAFMYVFVV